MGKLLVGVMWVYFSGVPSRKGERITELFIKIPSEVTHAAQLLSMGKSFDWRSFIFSSTVLCIFNKSKCPWCFTAPHFNNNVGYISTHLSKSIITAWLLIFFLDDVTKCSGISCYIWVVTWSSARFFFPNLLTPLHGSMVSLFSPTSIGTCRWPKPSIVLTMLFFFPEGCVNRWLNMQFSVDEQWNN